jgi:hypothetical protein
LVKCNHEYEREKELFKPNFWGKLIGEKEKIVNADRDKPDVRYLKCKKCGARAICHMGSNVLFEEIIE